MFLAHIPAGYMVSKLLLSQFRLEPSKTKLLIFIGLFGSVFPDLDMFYFHLIDNRQHIHHSYWSHIPFYWLTLLGIGYTIAAIFRSRTLVAAATVFVAGILCHLLLDTFVGGIQWLHPFSAEYIRIVTIPARYNYWIWNYVLHWTALVELTIITMAGAMYWKTKKPQ